MAYYHTYRRGYRHTRRPYRYDQDDMEKIARDIENDAEDSEKVNRLKAKVERDNYRSKIKKLKQKVKKEFEEEDLINFQRFRLMGDPFDPTKDFISVIFLILDDDHDDQIFEQVYKFLKEGIIRTGLTTFFNVENFGDEDASTSNEIEFIFLRENHSYDRLKQKPRFKDQENDEDRVGGAPPAGGAGEPGFGAGPEPEVGGEVGGDEVPEPAAGETVPEPEGGEEEI